MIGFNVVFSICSQEVMNVHTPQTKQYIVESARETPLLDSADVVVLGGGPGGVAAAVSAARNGTSVILVERFGTFGGTWTSGHLGAIMAFPYVRGLFTEIVERLQKESAWLSYGQEYGSFGAYDIEQAKIVLDRLVVEQGIRPYFFAHVCGVVVEEQRITGVLIESKQGRHVITGNFFIDATGDGDVCALAGVPYAKGRDEDGLCQPMTMIFTMDGADDVKVRSYKEEDPDFAKAWNTARKTGEVSVPREDVLAFPMPRAGQWSINTTRVVNLDGTKLQDVTDAMIEGRRQVAEVANFLRRRIPGFDSAWLSGMAPHIGVRESRRIKCDYTMTTEDIVNASQFEDAIARGNWFIDIHNPSGEGTIRIRPPEGKWYEIPYRSICVQGYDNLLIASRCLDSTHEAHAAVRITPQVVAIGQGAGTAAALCVQDSFDSIRNLDPTKLRTSLRKQGAFV